ncbi:MAG: DUF6186 family protein [Acidimicrobiales bacterium]
MSFVPWICAAAVLCGCAIAGRVFARGWPTAGLLLNEARASLAGRAGLVIAWLWVGWHFFAR